MSEYAICRKCGEGVSVRDGEDHTGYCDECAQAIAVAAREFVEEHIEDYRALVGTSSPDLPVEYTALCEAVLPLEELLPETP